jgi:hypothetical protein
MYERRARRGGTVEVVNTVGEVAALGFLSEKGTGRVATEFCHGVSCIIFNHNYEDVARHAKPIGRSIFPGYLSRTETGEY